MTFTEIGDLNMYKNYKVDGFRYNIINHIDDIKIIMSFSSLKKAKEAANRFHVNSEGEIISNGVGKVFVHDAESNIPVYTPISHLKQYDDYIIDHINNKATIAYIVVGDIVFSSFSICSDSDNFSRQTGIAVAIHNLETFRNSIINHRIKNREDLVEVRRIFKESVDVAYSESNAPEFGALLKIMNESKLYGDL